MFSAPTMAATTPATGVSLPSATSAPNLALSRVNITSGTMARGNRKACQPSVVGRCRQDDRFATPLGYQEAAVL
jgi:hypothetical protein